MRYELSIAASKRVLDKVEERVADEMKSSDKVTALKELIAKIIGGCTNVLVEIKEDTISLIVETQELVADIVQQVERYLRNKYHQHLAVSGGLA